MTTLRIAPFSFEPMTDSLRAGQEADNMRAPGNICPKKLPDVRLHEQSVSHFCALPG
jgi:hypothetical protein